MLCLAELDPSPVLKQNSITIPPVWIGLLIRGLWGQHGLGCGVSFPIAGIVILVRNVYVIFWSLDVDCMLLLCSIHLISCILMAYYCL